MEATTPQAGDAEQAGKAANVLEGGEKAGQAYIVDVYMEKWRAGETHGEAKGATLEAPAPKDSAAQSEATMTSTGSLPTLNLELEDQTLLRGVALPGLLARLGWHFKARALADQSFTDEEAAHLFAHSRRVDALTDFLTHSWRDKAINKFLTLCLFYNSLPAALFSSMLALVPFFIQLAGLAPLWFLRPDQQGNLVSCSFYCTAIGFATYPVAMLSWHRLPAWLGGGRSSAVFFDKLCVHQTDDARKQAGIRSFGAFIARSDRLLLLWSPSYFQRLWCTLEVAAFVRIEQSKKQKYEEHLGDKLAFKPLQLGYMTIQLVCFVQLYFVVNITGNSLFRPVFGLDAIVSTICSVALVFVVMPGAIHSVRTYVRDRDDLVTQLEQFDVKQASCFRQEDRVLVYDTIRHWFGSLEQFNMHVKTKVSKYMLSTIPSSANFPFKLSSVTYPPCLFFFLDWTTYYLRYSDRALGVSKILALPLVPIIVELSLAIGFRVASWPRVKRRRASAAFDAAISVVLGVVFALMNIIVFSVTILFQGEVLHMAAYVLFVFFAVAALRCDPGRLVRAACARAGG